MRSGQIAGYVLAGGASSRFGQDKALIELAGMPMVLRTCELVRSVSGEATVIAAPQKYAHLDLKIVSDRWPGEGPLGGIITALMATSEANRQAVGPDRLLQAAGRQWNLILGCDMPFLTRKWLTHLTERALASDAEVVAPSSAQGLEPLCACWRTSAFSTLQSAFNDGVRKITQAMKRLEMEIVDESGWKRFDSAGRLFWNMNAPSDYEEAKRILAAEHT